MLCFQVLWQGQLHFTRYVPRQVIILYAKTSYGHNNLWPTMQPQHTLTLLRRSFSLWLASLDWINLNKAALAAVMVKSRDSWLPTSLKAINTAYKVVLHTHIPGYLPYYTNPSNNKIANACAIFWLHIICTSYLSLFYLYQELACSCILEWGRKTLLPWPRCSITCTEI